MQRTAIVANLLRQERTVCGIAARMMKTAMSTERRKKRCHLRILVSIQRRNGEGGCRYGAHRRMQRCWARLRAEASSGFGRP